jgi:alpha-beta hydrolase superfamily lysophospholipase
MTTRLMSGRGVETGCDSDSTTVAEIVGPQGSVAIRCEPWDIGTGVAGYVWRAPNARAVVLLQHGWGDYSQRYAKQSSELIPRLLERGVSVFAIDLWGNGRSPGTRGATDIDDAVTDHLAARAKLREQALPVFVVGHSVGGLVTATSVLRDQRDVRGMILIAPALKWNVNGLLRFVAQTGAFIVPTFSMPVPPGSPADQSRDVAFNQRLTKDPLYHHGPISWVTAGSGAATAHDNWRRYREITAPTLVVTGSGDNVAAPAAATAFVDVVRSPDKALALIEGGRHSLLDDPPSSGEALQAILLWLDRRVPPVIPHP